MRLRHVVTVFLEHPDGERLLAGHRSEDVHTYPGHWAGISGSVEPDEQPAEAAERELREETSLDEDAYEVCRAGQAVRALDWGAGYVWIIHPFLFRCLRPQDVRRDWEHVELQWVAPDELWPRRTVPRLRQAWESAQQGTGRPEEMLERVREDREHGAEQLGIWTLQALQQAAAEGADARETCRRALELRPSMAAVRSAALRAWEALRAGEPQRLPHRVEERRTGPLQAAAMAARQLPDGAHVVTLSRSFTVLCTLHEARERIGRLTVAESRPAREGRGVAETAAAMGIPTELVTDAAACATVRGADAVLLGADSLTGGMEVVNKTGSLALCAAARQFGTPAVVVATPGKVLPRGVEPQMEHGDAEELGEPIEGVEFRNPTFERVPADMVGPVVLPRGPVTRMALADLARELRELQDDLATD
jgi:translation initiation factor 2B subunit (eIF-2B alpha/beta/delta family)/8-oxo-dGTP pyrophosphatase MutT (NUDIX family)